MQQPETVTVSIVSHGHGELVAQLLSDLNRHCATPLAVILTLNIPEALPFEPEQYRFPVELVKNDRPKGFGANHNAAFALATTDYFCVLNPDIRLEQDPFSTLIEQLRDPVVGVVAPIILGPSGQPEDSMRRFPTPWSILKKAAFGGGGPEYRIGGNPVEPDWVAGMFMFFRSEVYAAIKGFDENYFLYYEDVDLCWRLGREGLRARVVPPVSVIHHARRESRRNFRFLKWHVASMLRFFLGCVFSNRQGSVSDRSKG